MNRLSTPDRSRVIQGLTVISAGNGDVIINDDIVVTKEQLELFRSVLA